MRTAFEGEGDVRSVDLTGALATLWRERASGVLEFSRSDRRTRFDILDGAVVAASSSDSSLDAAEVLIRAGKLDPAAIGGRKFRAGEDRARWAKERGLLAERDWRWGEKIRVVETLSDVIGWPEGRYTFDPDEPPEPAELRLGIERLLLELFLRSRDREFVHRSLGAPDAPLARSADFDESFAALGLTTDAALVAAAIDGRTSAAEISRRIPPDPFSVEKLLAALTTLGLVHPVYAVPDRGRRKPPKVPDEAGPTPAPSPKPPEEEVAAPEIRQPVEETPLELLPVEETPPTDELVPAPEEPELRHEFAQDLEPSADLPLAPPTGISEPEPVITSWEQIPAEPLDQRLAVVEPPTLIRPGRSIPVSLWVLIVLAAAVGGLLLFRSRENARTVASSAASEPAAIPASPTAAVAARSTPPAPMAAVPTTAASPRPAATSTIPATAALPTHRPTAFRPTAAPVAPVAVPSPRAGGDRRAWTSRAARDRAARSRDRRMAYSIQLELVCELPSLEEAWRYDRGGAMWLLAADHRGRECFRVLWGSYETLDQARSAKGSVPRFFFTPTNQPTIVSTRALLP
jgi:hypothetical protein